MKTPSVMALGVLALITACASPPGSLPTIERAPALQAGAHLMPPATWLPYMNQQLTSQYPSRLIRRRITPLGGWETAVETKLDELTNRTRMAAGRSPIYHHPTIRDVARYHSLDQASRNYTSDVSPEGKNTADRLNERRFTFYTAHENVHRVVAATPEEAAAKIMSAWLRNPSQLSKILSVDTNNMGIGVFKNRTDGSYVATQIFAKVPPSGD